MSKKKDGTAPGRPTRVPKAAEPAKPTTGTTRKAGGGATPKAKKPAAVTPKVAPAARRRAAPSTTAGNPAARARKPAESALARRIQAEAEHAITLTAAPTPELVDEPAPDDTPDAAVDSSIAEAPPAAPEPYRPFEAAAMSTRVAPKPASARAGPSARTLPIGLVFLVVTMALILGLFFALGVFHKQ